MKPDGSTGFIFYPTSDSNRIKEAFSGTQKGFNCFDFFTKILTSHQHFRPNPPLFPQMLTSRQQFTGKIVFRRSKGRKC